MTDKEQKVSVSVFNWGPCVVKLKMMDDFKQLLLDEAKNNTRSGVFIISMYYFIKALINLII